MSRVLQIVFINFTAAFSRKSPGGNLQRLAAAPSFIQNPQILAKTIFDARYFARIGFRRARFRQVKSKTATHFRRIKQRFALRQMRVGSEQGFLSGNGRHLEFSSLLKNSSTRQFSPSRRKVRTSFARLFFPTPEISKLVRPPAFFRTNSGKVCLMSRGATSV